MRSRAQEAAKAKIVANIRESLADCKVCDLSYLTEEAEKSGFGKLRDCLKEAIYTSHPECFFGRGYERLPHIFYQVSMPYSPGTNVFQVSVQKYLRRTDRKDGIEEKWHDVACDGYRYKLHLHISLEVAFDVDFFLEVAEEGIRVVHQWQTEQCLALFQEKDFLLGNDLYGYLIGLGKGDLIKYLYFIAEFEEGSFYLSAFEKVHETMMSIGNCSDNNPIPLSAEFFSTMIPDDLMFSSEARKSRKEFIAVPLPWDGYASKKRYEDYSRGEMAALLGSVHFDSRRVGVAELYRGEAVLVGTVPWSMREEFEFLFREKDKLGKIFEERFPEIKRLYLSLKGNVIQGEERFRGNTIKKKKPEQKTDNLEDRKRKIVKFPPQKPELRRKDYEENEGKIIRNIGRLAGGRRQKSKEDEK